MSLDAARVENREEGEGGEVRRREGRVGDVVEERRAEEDEQDVNPSGGYCGEQQRQNCLLIDHGQLKSLSQPLASIP